MITPAVTTATVSFPCTDPNKCNFNDVTRTGTSAVDFSVDVDDKISGLEFLRLIAQKTNCPVSHQKVTIFELKGSRSVEGGYMFSEIAYHYSIETEKSMQAMLNTFTNPYITLQMDYCHGNQCGTLAYTPSIYEEMPFGKGYRPKCSWASDLQNDLKQG